MILINNLTKKFNNNLIFEDLSISFENKINFILGANGQGKSTLINILAGALLPENGDIFFNNIKIKFHDGSYKMNVGFLLTFPVYPKQYKVKEYIEMLNFIYSNSKDNKQHEDELIKFFNLNNYLNTKITNLSFGYIKRIMLLGSMLHNPDYLVLDEPFTGLDEEFIVKLETRIIELSKQGKFFFIATHQINDTLFNDSNCDKFIISNFKINKI